MAAVFGRRLRRGAVTTAVAAAAVAALAASQAPGVTDIPRDERAGASGATPPAEDSATGNSPYYTDLPELKSPVPPTGAPEGSSDAKDAGLPATVLDAYKKAEASLATSKPGCNLPWQLLAAIGKVESGQARGGRVDANGTTLAPILGPVLNGNGFAKITDTDNGAYDDDKTHDRAVGPMQFIPSTWDTWAQDGNADGKKDPNNIYDAALAAGRYLCAGDRDLSVQGDLNKAILSYNHSTEYLNTVLTWLEFYRKGTHEIPDGTGVLPTDRSDVNTPGASPSPTPPASGSPSPHPSPKPPGSGSGSGSGKPNKPSKPGNGGGSTSPTPPSNGGGSETPAPPTPAERVASLKDAGTGKLSATAGDSFAERVEVRTQSTSGSAVAKAKVKFAIVGDTDARFPGGATTATVTTSATGKATAPALKAGEKTGEFTVRATVVGRSLPGIDYTATVTARQADALARTSDKALTCAPGAEFADQVEVKATYKGAAADRVAATATMIKSAGDATANDKGPYFKDADGKPVRTLKTLKTDANGVLKLPKMYADDTAGTFLLRVTTAGGATLTVELKVAAPAA
ncbi:lytic transglycosylase domain-containing protein [Streptomyces sp. NPDC048436]|uniref:lytic transglycosylase domain-containing protein n=1 Tax=Streptomyces sp. NPDC048436 TaxID=3365550 RepID=UPI00371DDA26